MLLLQGVFRSGTTVLFRTLRRDDQLECFYEPLHPNLLDHAREADSERPDHLKSSLYEEYRPLLDRLDPYLGAESFSPQPYLGTNDEAPALAAYLHCLIDTKNRHEEQSSVAIQPSLLDDSLARRGVSQQRVRPPRPRSTLGGVVTTPPCVRRWQEEETAEQRFREGIRRAKIADLMREFGYNPS